jgi:GNAT superfamily N-acetyltransferase
MNTEPIEHIEFKKAHYLISTDKSKLDLTLIHDFLRQSYWALNRPLSVVQRSVENSLCFGVYEREQQIGFARIISDFATFAYLADVFILATHRGKGLGKWLIECIVTHPRLQGLSRWLLATKDAHGLYAQYDFQPLAAPERFMEIYNPANPERAHASDIA